MLEKNHLTWLEKKPNKLHKKVTILERGPSNMIIYRDHIKSDNTSSIYHIIMLGKLFPRYNPFKTTPVYMNPHPFHK